MHVVKNQLQHAHKANKDDITTKVLQVTKANKDDVTIIKLQRSINKCPSVYKVNLVVQLGLDVKDDLKYNKVNK